MAKNCTLKLKLEKKKGKVYQAWPRIWTDAIRLNQRKKVRAGSTVTKAPRSASSGFSLKPELRTPGAAVEAARHNPKVQGKEEARRYQGQGHGQEVGSAKTVFSMPEAMGNLMELSLTGTSHNEDCYDFFKNLRDSD
jgi:hypothetical protein